MTAGPPPAEAREAALRAHRAGLCVVPPREDGTKIPDADGWKQYQDRQPTPAELAAWYANGRTGVGIVCGLGGVEFFDFDESDAFEEYATRARASGLGELFERVSSGYLEQTPKDGRHFAIRHSDLHFDAVETPEASTPRIAETKRLAQDRGREIQVWTPVGIVCRPTQREADDFLQYVVDHADWGAIGYLAGLHAREGRQRTDPQRLVHSSANPLARRALARGSYCVVGDPDAVARELARLQTAGLDGLAINFVDYLKELPYFAAEVLPRLERLGLRRAVHDPA